MSAFMHSLSIKWIFLLSFPMSLQKSDLAFQVIIVKAEIGEKDAGARSLLGRPLDVIQLGCERLAHIGQDTAAINLKLINRR